MRNRPRRAAGDEVLTLPLRSPICIPNPRIGERLEEFEPRDVRRIQIGHYEMRYEIVDSTIYLLRIWHTREDR